MADAGKLKKNSVEKVVATFKWTVPMVNGLLDCLLEFKTDMEYNNRDFNADKVKLYEAIRHEMAVKYSQTDDGSMFVSPEPSTNKINDEDMKMYKKRCDVDKIKLKKGYSRIKEKIKELRPNFSTAVTLVTRSGSGKLVLEFYDLIVHIWGGSPAAKPLSFGCDVCRR